jgi:hypothetical protein
LLKYWGDERIIMSENKKTNDLINSAIESFLREEPIDDILVKINSGREKFNNWVYDEHYNLIDSEYAWLIDEYDIFMPDQDLFEYYRKEELDLKTDQDILNFMNTAIDAKCEYADAYHYELYRGVYISATCEHHGQGGFFFRDFCLYKTKDDFFDFCKGSIINSSEWGIKNSEAELISMFKENVTDKYFKD